jgi:hypothetical protein
MNCVLRSACSQFATYRDCEPEALILDNIIGNGLLFVGSEYPMVLTAKDRYPRSPGGALVQCSPRNGVDRNAYDLVNGSVGGWTPLRENESKDIFDDMIL